MSQDTTTSKLVWKPKSPPNNKTPNKIQSTTDKENQNMATQKDESESNTQLPNDPYATANDRPPSPSLLLTPTPLNSSEQKPTPESPLPPSTPTRVNNSDSFSSLHNTHRPPTTITTNLPSPLSVPRKKGDAPKEEETLDIRPSEPNHTTPPFRTKKPVSCLTKQDIGGALGVLLGGAGAAFVITELLHNKNPIETVTKLNQTISEHPISAAFAVVLYATVFGYCLYACQSGVKEAKGAEGDDDSLLSSQHGATPT